MNSDSAPSPVVLLVDSKTRDLDVAVLIAHHLRALGVGCHLEPLEAYRAVVAAYRPGLILFNHLTASHLVSWSRRLAELGVLTAVLPNEGIMYDPDDLKYSSGRHHSAAHIDYFFCWNEPHRQALLAEGFDRETRVEVVGVPRFDFYFAPWSRVLHVPPLQRPPRPRVLVCTNFVTAQFFELPPAEGDKFFAPWKDRIPIYRNYRRSIEAHWQGRRQCLDFLSALTRADRYEVTVRPHPREDVRFYSDWIASLPASQRAHVKLDANSNVSALILDCDLEISCETCTTALESWIAGKPTIELIFERDVLWYREEQADANVPCINPADLPALVESHLTDPKQPAQAAARQRHLERWCAAPDGTSCQRLARILADAVLHRPPPDASKFTATDRRRAAKLLALRKLGLAYHFDPFMPLKRAVLGDRYAIKDFAYRKSIKPADVMEAQRRLEAGIATGRD